MKPCALCDSALLCRGPIQNSLSHFNPPLPTTQRLRNSVAQSTLGADFIRIAAFQLLAEKSCAPEMELIWQAFGSQPKGLSGHFKAVVPTKNLVGQPPEVTRTACPSPFGTIRRASVLPQKTKVRIANGQTAR